MKVIDDTEKQRNIRALYCLVYGIFFFVIFALDIEYDRDVTTWFWLLTS